MYNYVCLDELGEFILDKKTEKERVTILMDPALLKRIEDFRYKQRFPSRSEAIIWLLEYCLNLKPKREDQSSG
jgi:metal-responsive CopG/Arc/MetJ family transcriptional regulator